MAEQRPPCSVVLEGGVTSAVIYASLLARLSKHYAYRQLGGASSGAMAAAAAAAAELARMSAGPGGRDPFELLADFPSRLATVDASNRTTLFTLFQPSREGLASFNVAMAALDVEGDGDLRKAGLRVAGALVDHFWPAAYALILVVAVLAIFAGFWLGSHFACTPDLLCPLVPALLWLATVVLAAAVALAVLVLLALRATVIALRENHWGLCSGMTRSELDQGEGLTPTLHALLQSLAGRGSGPPLTFGDLWTAPRPADPPVPYEPGERSIDLQIITSAVSLSRPVRLPGEPGDDPLREFFYDPSEWETLFPPDVMQHLLVHARPATLTHDDGRVLLALPEPREWPVLMAARFSLSFPVLLSAVPMYIAVPRHDVLRGEPDASGQPFEARKVYFSDGGITSNCPVHLFDAPLPRFPTFGVNLYRRPRGQRPGVVRSDEVDPELAAQSLTDAGRWRTPLPFLGAIFETMFSWRDNLQRRLPGYRERIVHVGVPRDAGGLHLAMTGDTIRLLATLGKVAARRLRRDFSLPRNPGEPNAWERHRWTRVRSTLSALRPYLTKLDQRVAAGKPDYDRLLRQSTPDRHAFADDAARQQALGLVNDIQSLVRQLETAEPDDAMDGNRPAPQPKLHMSPPW